MFEPVTFGATIRCYAAQFVLGGGGSSDLTADLTASEPGAQRWSVA
jgi:hypothetical protein